MTTALELPDDDDIEKITDVNELRKKLLDAFTLTVGRLVYMAAIVKRLEELGEDLTDMEISMMPQLRRIAYGQVSAELVVSLLGKTTLLRKASALPLPDQKKLAEGKPVKVALADGDFRMVPAKDLTSKEVKQVFAADHIRDEGEQASWLRAHAPAPVTVDAEWEKEKVYPDKKRGGLVIGDRFIKTAELARYLSILTEK